MTEEALNIFTFLDTYIPYFLWALFLFLGAGCVLILSLAARPVRVRVEPVGAEAEWAVRESALAGLRALLDLVDNDEESEGDRFHAAVRVLRAATVANLGGAAPPYTDAELLRVIYYFEEGF